MRTLRTTAFTGLLLALAACGKDGHDGPVHVVGCDGPPPGEDRTPEIGGDDDLARAAPAETPEIAELADLFAEAALSGDPEIVAEAEAVEAGLPDDVKVTIADALAARVGAKEPVDPDDLVDEGIPPLTDIPECAFPAALRYTPLGVFAAFGGGTIADEVGTTTSCGGDVDGALHYDDVEGAWDHPEALVAWDTSLIRYGALLAMYGGAVPVYRLESDDDLRVCVDGGISGATTGTAAAALLVTNLFVGVDLD